jgi:hypothetical protein
LKDRQLKRARFTEDQIIGVLREHERGAKTADLARKHEPSGINRIYRHCREKALTVRKRRARRAVGSPAPILVESKSNARWSVNFVHDQLVCGRRSAAGGLRRSTAALSVTRTSIERLIA